MANLAPELPVTADRTHDDALRRLARRWFPPILWDGLRLLARKAGRGVPRREYYGLQELDRKLETYVDFDGGFFIEIGGWDGVTFSNTLYFERFRNWRGLLVEPNPGDFLNCRKNRPHALTVCCACVPFGYPERFVPMTYCASMTAAHSGGGLINQLPDLQEHLRSGDRFLATHETRFEFGAVAKALSDVIDELKIDAEVDLLVLDVEGFELNVLRGIDFARHAPKFICVEVWNLEEVNGFLTANGYVLLDKLSKHDYLFRRADATDIPRRTESSGIGVARGRPQPGSCTGVN